MANMAPHKVPMPEQQPDVRNHNFLEVATGYTEEMAVEEAARCLHCKNQPCVAGCPVNVHIPAFIEKVDRELLDRLVNDPDEAAASRIAPPELDREFKNLLFNYGQYKEGWLS